MLCQLTVGCHFVLFIMADVIAMALSFWLMLLPMCDVWQMLWPLGRCYSHVGGGLAVVSQANVADVMATRV